MSVPTVAPKKPDTVDRTPPRAQRAWLAVALVIVLVATTAVVVTRDTTPEDAAPVAGSETPTTPAERAPASLPVLRLAGGTWGGATPFTYSRGPGLMHMFMTFDSLLWKDAAGEMIPWLAESWEPSADGTEWRFELRPDITWHDGEPFTAEDVQFTFEYLTSGPGQVASGGFLGPVEVSDVVVESPTTLVFRLGAPYAPFEELVAGRVPIIPEHIWSTVDDPAQYREPAAYIGTGPYRLEDIDEAAGTYLYAANESFFLGVPFMRRLEFIPAPQELLALERGDIDIATVGVSSAFEEAIPDASLEPLQEPGFETLAAPGEWHRAIHFNHTRGFPFDDARFRHAVATAIDRPALVDLILNGRGEVGSSGGLAQSHAWAAPGLPAYDFDTTGANALLDEIGMVDVTGDGMRELPDGSAFAPVLMTNARFNEKTPQLVQEYLRGVGLNVQVQSLEQAAADAAAAEGNYEMALIGYGGMGGDADSLRTRLSAAVKAQNFQRVYGWENAEFEELAGAQLRATDPAVREGLVKEMQAIVAEDLPLISLYLPSRMAIYRVDVFDDWYWTPGGIFGSYPSPLNKAVLVTGSSDSRS